MRSPTERPPLPAQAEIDLFKQALISRRKILGGALGMGLTALLVACGGDDDDGEPAATSEPAADPTDEPEATATPASDIEPAETAAPEPTATTEKVDEPTAMEPEPTEASEATIRTVDTPFGPVEVPANPQRVIALGEEFMLADLLDLGIKPIGSTSSLSGGFYALDHFDTSAIERFDSQEPDIERLVALQPDLLITYTWFAEAAGIDLLNQLAPTVAIDPSDYRAAYTDIAATFGVERAAERLAEYDELAQSIGAELGASGRTASVATIYPGATDVTVWLAGPADLPQALLDMSFTMVPNTERLEPMSSQSRAFISLEQVNMLTGEDLFMMQSESIEGEAESLAEMTASDLWARIPAVAAGRVHTFDRLGYPGVEGRIRILGDIQAALAE